MDLTIGVVGSELVKLLISECIAAYVTSSHQLRQYPRHLMKTLGVVHTTELSTRPNKAYTWCDSVWGEAASLRVRWTSQSARHLQANQLQFAKGVQKKPPQINCIYFAPIF